VTWCSRRAPKDWQTRVSSPYMGESQENELNTRAISPRNTLASSRFQGFSRKNTETHAALRGNFSGRLSATDPAKSSKDTENLVASTLKNFFGRWVQIFWEWRHKWRTFRSTWPTSPSPGPKPLDGSVSLKFLLETRLQCESFDTSDDLLAFQVQKLRS